jgi:hypothetical protein
VREHVETLFDEARGRSESGFGYPRFVEHEFRRYLDCGLLSGGFGRLRCPDCGDEKLLAFSCKGRICPSCWARRTAETAAHLVDRVLPEAPYRQWVLTLPWQIRFLLAVDHEFLSEMLATFTRTVFAWQRRRGRVAGLHDAETGAVTFIQRFGGVLNLFPHFHSMQPDGLFVPSSAGDEVEFRPLPPPTDEELTALATRLARRLTDVARCHVDDEGLLLAAFSDEDKACHASAAEALVLPFGLGRDSVHDDPGKKPLCARVGGISLHAARRVEADDRAGLERLCRYGMRAPFSTDRITMEEDGRVRYRLHRPWPGPGGRTDVVMEPVAFLRRLAALIPSPYANLVRYHGVFANRSKYRPLLPAPPVAVQAASCEPATPESRAVQPANPPRTGTGSRRPRRMAWASLLKRVFDVDALTCPTCNVPMVVLAFLTDPHVVKRILDHLHLPSVPPPVAPARRRIDDNPSLALATDEYRDDWGPGSCDAFDEPQGSCAPRAPP